MTEPSFAVIPGVQVQRILDGREKTVLELVEAAYRAEVTQLCEAAATFLAEHEPDVALAEWMDRFVAYTAAKKGMKGALQSIAAGSDLWGETRRQIVAAIASLAAGDSAATPP